MSFSILYRRIASGSKLGLLEVRARLVVADSTLGASALRYLARRPALRGDSQPLFE